MSTIYWPAVHPRVTEEAGTRGGGHTGIDLAAQRGDPVLAPFDGEVVFVGGDGASGAIWVGGGWLYPNGQGKTIDIRRADGLISRVGHLEGYAVAQGQRVRAGQVIGYAGDSGYSTGVHIHWELRWDRAWNGGNWINPRSVNPQPYEEAIQGGPEVVPISKQDRRARTIKPGAHTWLRRANQTLDSQAENVVGAPGRYSITAHIYAEGMEPGDVLTTNLSRQNTKHAEPWKHASPHYTETLVADKNGEIRASVEWKLGTASGDMLFLAVKADPKNRKPARLTVLDTDGYLFTS